MPGHEILTINSGSSSVKFSIYRMGDEESRLFSGLIERIGLKGGSFTVKDAEGRPVHSRSIELPGHDRAFEALFSWIKENLRGRLRAVGHRVVHGGGGFIRPAEVTPKLRQTIEALIPFAPEHLPHEIKGIEAAMWAYPDVLHAACFDTSFHSTMPTVARVFPLPYELAMEGVVRYGFHGLSYEYISSELKRMGLGKSRAIIAHLGNGCSMAALRDGASVDTTMGFTPAGGLMMSRRSGDLDPGLLVYLMKEKGLDADSLNELINKRSGLLGVSGLSTDMKDLLDAEKTDERASLAISLFCYLARKHIASLASSLNGLDVLVFTAGMGENSAEIRKRVCSGMEFLGIFLDDEKNLGNSEVISRHTSPVKVMALHTNEELMIARHCHTLLPERDAK